MRILHTSDWHIGRQFHNQSLLSDQQQVLEQLITIVDTQQVDVVVIAGDIYDRSVPPAEAVSLLNSVLKRLCLEMQKPVIMISGNHDGAERLGFGAELLQASGLHILGDLTRFREPVTIRVGQEQVVFYGIPYCSPEEVRHLFDVDVKNFDDAHSYLVNEISANMDSAQRNVLISHCYVGGGEISESERPLSVGGADTVSWEPMRPFDYVALGHLHAPQFRGEQHIRYSGSLLQYSFSEENQRKGVYLVDLDTSLAPVPADITSIPLLPARKLRVLEGEFGDLLQQAYADEHRDDYLMIRLTDKAAILDAVGKLRTLYPNLLHLEKPGMMTDNAALLAREQLQRSEQDMFADFFEQTLNQPMSEAQRQALSDVIEKIHQQEANA